MRLLLIATLAANTAHGGWYADRKAHKAQKAAQKAEARETMRKNAERMQKRLWRQKQYAKLVDGLKDHLAKGRFKYLAIGLMGGTILTASGIWYFCHDGCRFFNPPTPPQE